MDISTDPVVQQQYKHTLWHPVTVICRPLIRRVWVTATMRESTSTRTCATPLGVEHLPRRNSPPSYAKSSKPASLISVNTTSTATAVGCRRWHTAATELFKRCHADCEQYKTLGFRWLPLILGSPFPLVIIWTHQVYVVPITCHLTSGPVIQTPHAFSPNKWCTFRNASKILWAFWILNWSF